MVLIDRLKGILRETHKKLNPVYAKIRLQLGFSERVDPSRGESRIRDISSRQQLPTPPIRQPSISVIGEEVSPFSAKIRYSHETGRYHDVQKGIFVDREHYLNAFSNHKSEVLRATVRRKNPNLSIKDINRAVKLLQRQRQDLNDIRGDLSTEEYRQRYQDQWEDIKDEFGIVS